MYRMRPARPFAAGSVVAGRRLAGHRPGSSPKARRARSSTRTCCSPTRATRPRPSTCEYRARLRPAADVAPPRPIVADVRGRPAQPPHRSGSRTRTPYLRDAQVSTRVTSDVPVVAERTMWWPVLRPRPGARTTPRPARPSGGPFVGRGRRPGRRGAGRLGHVPARSAVDGARRRRASTCTGHVRRRHCASQRMRNLLAGPHHAVAAVRVPARSVGKRRGASSRVAVQRRVPRTSPLARTHAGRREGDVPRQLRRRRRVARHPPAGSAVAPAGRTRQKRAKTTALSSPCPWCIPLSWSHRAHLLPLFQCSRVRARSPWSRPRRHSPSSRSPLRNVRPLPRLRHGADIRLCSGCRATARARSCESLGSCVDRHRHADGRHAVRQSPARDTAAVACATP